MTSPEKLADLLGPMARTFEKHVLWAVRAILETDVEVRDSFRVTEDPPSGPSLFCLIPNSSPEYHAQLAVGVAKDDLPELFPGEAGPKFRLDALGEMANVVAGLLMSDELFMGRFGHLRPSTPFFSEGDFTDRKDVGIQGAVTSGGRNILFHITVRPASQEGWAPAPQDNGANRE